MLRPVRITHLKLISNANCVKTNEFKIANGLHGAYSYSCISVHISTISQ